MDRQEGMRERRARESYRRLARRRLAHCLVRTVPATAISPYTSDNRVTIGFLGNLLSGKS